MLCVVQASECVCVCVCVRVEVLHPIDLLDMLKVVLMEFHCLL